MFSVAITKDKNLWRDVKIDDSRKRLVADNSICECIHAAAVSASDQPAVSSNCQEILCIAANLFPLCGGKASKEARMDKFFAALGVDPQSTIPISHLPRTRLQNICKWQNTVKDTC